MVESEFGGTEVEAGIGEEGRGKDGVADGEALIRPGGFAPSRSDGLGEPREDEGLEEGEEVVTVDGGEEVVDELDLVGDQALGAVLIEVTVDGAWSDAGEGDGRLDLDRLEASTRLLAHAAGRISASLPVDICHPGCW